MFTVVFCVTNRDDADPEELQAEQFRMLELLMEKPEFGCIDIKPYTSPDGETVVFVRFESREGFAAWRQDPEHRAIMHRGVDEWFQSVWSAELVMRIEWDRDAGYTRYPRDPDGSTA